MQIGAQELKKKRREIERVFFYRICGSGMGAAAKLLRDKGFQVEGGDVSFSPPMSDWLESSGIPLSPLKDVSAGRLSGFDLIVVGNVVPRGGEDAARIESAGIPFCSFPAALGALVLPGRRVVGVAGTHGKTTTTYLFVQVFERLGERPGYFIGGVIEGRGPAELGEGEHFFIESDEYDSAYFEKISKFRLYGIERLVVTSLEFDHGDIFGSLEDIKKQFRPLLGNLAGPVIFCDRYADLAELVRECGSEWSAYGKSGPLVRASSPQGSEFDLVIDGRKESFRTNLIGRHNLENLCAVILYARERGYSLRAIRSAVGELKMVKRRQEVRGVYRGAVVIGDFAHHPRAVRETIGAIKIAYPDRKIHVVLEPNSATARSDLFQEDFPRVLGGADRVTLARPAKATTVPGAGNLDLEKIVKTLPRAAVVSDLAELRERLDSQNGGVLLILSNGTCLGLWNSDFVQEIK